MKTYTSKGYVLGDMWGGGEAGYKAENVNGSTRKILLDRATKMLEEGSLDSGMGFESLIGAVLIITEIETIRKNGKPFYSDTEEVIFIGKLTDKQKSFLEDCLYQL